MHKTLRNRLGKARRFAAPALIALLSACAASGPRSTDEPPAQAGQDYRSLGREDAPVTMIEFTDLQCPYCARFAQQTFPRLKSEYIDTGRLRYASRDLPLSFHAYALPAAVAARCAGEQGQYWPYREALFARQATLDREPYDALAGELGLDLERFQECRKDPAQSAAVGEDVALARSHGIESTPSFVIGKVVDGQFVGQQFSGAEPYASVAARVDALLAQ
jgi:protein-disulfide isomerase